MMMLLAWPQPDSRGASDARRGAWPRTAWSSSMVPSDSPSRPEPPDPEEVAAGHAERRSQRSLPG